MTSAVFVREGGGDTGFPTALFIFPGGFMLLCFFKRRSFWPVINIDGINYKGRKMRRLKTK
jgi:hypothetical protein